jgi:hypothetical protein
MQDNTHIPCFGRKFWNAVWRDFEEEYFGRKGKCDYCSCQIIINNEVVVNFDPKPSAIKTEPCKLTSNDRTENIVRVPSASKSLGLLPKTHLLQGVYLAASLTREVSGGCVTSIINTTETDVTVEVPCVDLED